MYRPCLTLLTAAVLALALGASSCASASGPSGQPLAEGIGGTWMLETQQLAGQAETSPPAGAAFQLEIASDRAAITADCNRCSGPAAIGDRTITFGPPLACTRAFCGSAPFDTGFVQLLSGESSATISGNTLLLESGRGTLRLRRR